MAATIAVGAPMSEGQTEFSAEMVGDDHCKIRASNGAAGYTGYTVYWSLAEIEKHGLAELCSVMEKAMHESYEHLQRSMKPVDPVEFYEWSRLARRRR